MAVAASTPTFVQQKNGMIGMVKQMTVTLTCDHRHIYGADAAKSLADPYICPLSPVYLSYISPISRLYLAYITRSGADAAKFLADLADLIETDMESLLY